MTKPPAKANASLGPEQFSGGIRGMSGDAFADDAPRRRARYKPTMDDALQERLAETRERIAALQRQIAEHRTAIARLEQAGGSTGHAKYLLAGLELLEASHRAREKELTELGKAEG